MSKKVKRVLLAEIRNYGLIIIGALICAVSYVFFLAPNKIVAGGVSGLAITFYHIFDIPMGWMIFGMNVPLFLVGVKFLGKMYGVRTLVGIGLVSFFTDLLDGKYFAFIELEPVKMDIIIAAIFGGVLLGIGLGVIFRGKGSSGGSDIVAQILGRYTSFTPGMAFMVMDFFIIVFSGIVLGSTGNASSAGSANQWELIFYGLIALFVSSKVIDLVLQGVSTTKSVQIISDKKDQIIEYIHEKGRGATIYKAVGSYTNKDRDVVFCILSRKELIQLKEYIAGIDKEAFMIITDTHQVMGYGFSRFEHTNI
jgi:uncharacterized membrane-anchored protein YitT (DUF2179 family)